MRKFSAFLACLLLAACSPAGPSTTVVADDQPAQPKVLRVGLQREIGSFGGFGGGGGATVETPLVHDALVLDRQGVQVPQLASVLISIQEGTWQVNLDGSMDTTWRLRPGVHWHDGMALTATDVLFAYQLRKDASLPSASQTTLRTMASASTPDPLSFAAHWSQVNVRAVEAVGLEPLPRHLLEGVYQSGSEAFLAHPLLRTEFVGVGPYRMVHWESGVEMDLARFENYYQGPAPIDRIVLRYIADPTALVANILAGAVDVVVPPGVDLDAAAEIRASSERTGNQMIVGGFEDLNSAYTLQLRAEYASPRGGLTQRDVREALLRAVDRQAMTEAITFGLAPAADSWIAPQHGMRGQVEGAIPQYPYDLNRGRQLLTGAGWAPGPDGILVNAQTGERFKLELAGPVRPALQKQQAIIADAWKQIGVQGEIFVVPSALDLIAETRSTRPGVYLGSITAERYYFQDQLHSREITSASNWVLRNRGGYSNPAVDAVQDRLRVTIDQDERVALQREFVRLAMEDVALWPFYWDVYPVLAVGSVRAPIFPSKGNTLNNIMEWDKI